MENLLKGRGDPKKGGIIQEREDAVSLGIFSSWGVANVTTVTFNYILVIVFLFPLNVGVSPCFHCTYSFSFCLQGVYFLLQVTYFLFASWRCHFLFQSEHVVLIYLEMCHQSGVDERVHTYSLINVWSVYDYMFLYDGTWCQLHNEGSCIQCQQLS